MIEEENNWFGKGVMSLLLKIFIPISPFFGFFVRLLTGDPVEFYDWSVAIVATILYFFIMKTILGHPRNWWVPFGGVTMTIDVDQYIKDGKDPEALAPEIEDWVKNMVKGRYYKVNPYRYIFLHRRDAAMFKLAWS